MGCNTICYRKSAISLDQAYKAACKELRQYIRSERKQRKHQDRGIRDLPEFVEIAKWSGAFTRSRKESNHFVTDRGVYVEVPEFYDIFSIYFYPKDLLYSLEETLLFFEQHKIEKVDICRIKLFWRTYPEGLILFN